MVSHVLSSHEVYLQLSKDAADLEEMFDRLDEIYNSAVADENIEDLRRFSSTGQLTIGLLVCVHCRLSDTGSLDGWYRAEVLSVVDEPMGVNVLMVDYGITRMVAVESIYSLDVDELISHRPLAFLCNLFGVNSCGKFISFLTMLIFYGGTFLLYLNNL
jgi:Tudor domain